MSRPKPTVRHFVACLRVEVDRAYPDNPYTLRGVSYAVYPTEAAPGRFLFTELWLFARFFVRPGRYDVEVSTVWLDGPDGQLDLLTVPLPPLVAAADQPVVSRAYKLSYLPVPGPGRYMFRLRTGGRVIAEEFVSVPEVP